MDFSPIIGIAGQALIENALLIDEPPDQDRRHQRRRHEAPIGAERERNAQEIDQGARVHGMTDDGVGPGGHQALALGHPDRRRSK